MMTTKTVDESFVAAEEDTKTRLEPVTEAYPQYVQEDMTDKENWHNLTSYN